MSASGAGRAAASAAIPHPRRAGRSVAGVFLSLDPQSFGQAFDDAYFRNLLQRQFVSRDPELAYNRLVLLDGTKPERSGGNSKSIAGLRKAIGSVDRSPFAHMALMITAPHSHWPAGAIFETYERERERYWIGPDQVFTRVWPISFVFSPEGVLPYEWADESVFDELDSLDRAYRLIAQVAVAWTSSVAFPGYPAPLGLAINHRFKRIAGPALWDTLEIPDEDRGLSYVQVDRQERSNLPFAGQVGWSVHTGDYSSERFRKAGDYLDSVLTRLTFEQAQALLDALRRSGVERAGQAAPAMNR